MLGIPQVGMRGVTRTTQDIMREEATHQGEPRGIPQLMNEHEMPDKHDAPMNPESPKVASIPPMPLDQMLRTNLRPGASPFAAQTVGVNFTATNLASIGAFPPDNDGAVGPTQYIVAVNNRIISFNKSTGAADGVLNTTTNTFFTSVRNGSSTSDPTIRYDRLTARWFVTIINVSTPNRWLLAVSDAASNGTITAGTVWTYYYFIPATTSPSISNGTTCLSDYPTLGIDANALYTGMDEFCGTGQPFQQVDAFVIRKSSVLSGGPIVVTAFRGLMSASTGYSGPFAPRGVDNNDPTSNEGYFVGPDGNSWGNMWIHRVANPGGTPTIAGTMIALPAEDGPRPVVHPGNTGGYWGYLDALDDRYFQAYMLNHQIWTSHNIGVDNTGVSEGTYTGDARSAARWFQISVPVNTGTPTITQMGTVFTPSATNDSLSKNYFIPSIMVSGQGHAAMGFSTAGANDYVNCGFVGRLATDPLGTMQAATQLTTNTSNTYNPTSDPGGASAGRPRRWGDYSQTTLDPLDDMSMWTVQQFVDANNSYGVRVARLIAPPPATPSAMADVAQGLPSVTVTLTGASSNGSGFYDPGADLAAPARPYNHLTAAITAGAATGTPPSVVSVSYVNPTTLSVTLNTSAATPNLVGQMYTITVTNPDGQSAAAAVVHVVGTTIMASAGTGGTISPSGSVQVPYNTDQAFTITANPCYSIADVLVDGSSVGPVSAYTFHNVIANHTIAASFVAGLTNAVTGLAAAQVKTGNGPGNTTGVTINYTVPLGSTSVEVWRKGFGSYPLYGTSPGTGAAPAVPGAYPPAGWTLTSVTASGQVDQPGSRDLWYYVAYGRDGCGDATPVSAMTAGTLDYHLGDVTDGVTPGTGDNSVNVADASLLGMHYGASGGSLAGFEYLDVGPTTDHTTNGRPTPDGVVDFEDLILYALNFTPHVSGPAATLAPTGMGESVSLDAPASVKAGDAFDVTVTLSAGGSLQGLSLALAWDPAVVRPAGFTSGGMVESQGGVVLSPRLGGVDAALLGVGPQGLAGEGTLATFHFRALAAGAPRLSVARVTGRDAHNQPVTIAAPGAPAVEPAVTATELLPVVPNPTRGSAQLRYTLSRPGTVRLAIYDVDGRLVRTLVQGDQAAGRYSLNWDGTDARGAAFRSGLFFVRLEAAGVRKTRVVSVIR